MKKFECPAIDDMEKLEILLEERLKGLNRDFFSINAQALKDAWQEYLTKESRVTEIAARREPWASNSAKLKNLYPGIGEKVQAIYIKSIRDKYEEDTRLLCPYCGRPIFDEIDHYLPKSEYSEYSVLSKNLVPSCSKCNGKKDSLTPLSKDEYFLHPYYSQGINEQLIKFEINPPFEAFTVCLKVISGLSNDIKSRVLYQVEKLELEKRLKKDVIGTVRTTIDLLRKNDFNSYDDFIEYLKLCSESDKSRYQSMNGIGYLSFECMLNNLDFLNYVKDKFFNTEIDL